MGARPHFAPELILREVVPPPRSAAATHLAAVAARQDRDAFAALFGHFAPRVKSYLLRLGADPVTAEDLAQETMLAVWRKAAQFDPVKADASTWIFTIARNLRIDALRRERHPEIGETDPSLVPEALPAADDMLQAAEIQARLRLSLNELPDAEAEVVRLSFFADKSHREIERELGIPLGTVKSRLRLAMRRIRAALGDQL